MSDKNLGLAVVECEGLPVALHLANEFLKFDNLSLLGYEKSGNGSVSVLAYGEIPALEMALEQGILSAEEVGEIFLFTIIPEPHPELLSRPGLIISQALSSPDRR